MALKERIQNDMKAAMKSKDSARLDCLRMLKGAILLKEKESSAAVSEEDIVGALRSEIRKRQETLEICRQHGKLEEAAAAEREIAIIGEYLPAQLSEAQLEDKARAYAAAHPEVKNAGQLTGALKRELGDAADGRLLNAVCRRVFENPS